MLQNHLLTNNSKLEDFYLDAAEAIPFYAPKPRGKSVIVSYFDDASHAGNRITHCSHAGIIIFCNHMPIMWFS